VERLRLIKRLLDQGHRPSKLIAASADELNELIRGNAECTEEAHCQELLRLVRVAHADQLRLQLSQALLQQGLVRFVCDTLTPLNRLVGEAWLRGDLQVFDEHLYSELVENILRAAIGLHAVRAGVPRILMTTVPEEEHSLGLLMAEAMMTAEGALCISLGTRTPLTDIDLAAREGRFDVVALSFSARCSTRITHESLSTLRAQMPKHIELWAGGAGVRVPDRLDEGIHAITSIAGAQDAVRQWRQRHRSS
jgi:methanogenic corrinoid protein MtbC1